MDAILLIIGLLIAFWVIGVFMKIGGVMIHIVLFLALIALGARFLNLI